MRMRIWRWLRGRLGSLAVKVKVVEPVAVLPANNTATIEGGLTMAKSKGNKVAKVGKAKVKVLSVEGLAEQEARAKAEQEARAKAEAVKKLLPGNGAKKLLATPPAFFRAERKVIVPKRARLTPRRAKIT